MLHDIYSICTIELILYEKFVYTKGGTSDIQYTQKFFGLYGQVTKRTWWMPRQ